YKDHPHIRTHDIILKNKSEVYMFLTMLKYMTPLDSSEVKIKPSDIIDTREEWWSPYGFDTNDPIQVRGKIIIYKVDGTKEEGYFDYGFYIDIFGWRYRSKEIHQVLMGFFHNYNPDTSGLF
ncbi:MAG: hypothetical protein K2M98_05285, partial [Muribaculum sp.]|nr:hypothetical protein [Muribaculum sp.]